MLNGLGLMMKSNEISNYLNELFPNPKCELNYNSDYELLIAIMLSAQSTDKRVNSVTPILFSKYNSLDKLKAADISDLENIIRSVGSYRIKARHIKNIATLLCDEYNYVVPRDRDELIKFSGVGRKTANVFLSEYYKEPFIAVDTHVNRVSKRLKLAPRSADVYAVEKKLMKNFPASEWARIHLQMVLFGRYYCKAIKPLCSDCKLKEICIEKKKNL